MQGQSIFYDNEGLLPIQREFYENRSSDPHQERVQLIQRLMMKGIHRPMLHQYTLMSDILSLRLHQILSGELSVESGLGLAKEEIDAVIARGNTP